MEVDTYRHGGRHRRDERSYDNDRSRRHYRRNYSPKRVHDRYRKHYDSYRPRKYRGKRSTSPSSSVEDRYYKDRHMVNKVRMTKR